MLITVVVPTYNRRRLLAQCLESLFHQTCAPDKFEIIIVIDGSTDSTRDYLHSLSFPCAHQVLEQDNRGQAAARNAGILAARGEYVLLLDDDFVCDPNLISAHLAARSDSGSVVVGPILRDPANNSIPALAIDREIRPYYERLEAAANQPAWFPPNSSVPRQILLACGAYDERFSSAREDTDLGIRLAGAGVRFRYAPNAVVRQHYDKSANQLIASSALFGKHDVLLARKFSEYGAQSNLSRIDSGPWWKRAARRLAATLPFSPEPLLYPFYVVSALLANISLMHEAAIRLLNLRRYIVWIRTAVREAGGWQALQSITAPPAPLAARASDHADR
jgi:glycosyltransferase involved in cell wall biosynthesis